MAKVQPRDLNVPAGSRAATAGVEGPGPSRILTINGGSSSLKFALFDRTEPSARLLSGQFDRIGLKDARWVTAHAGGGRKEDRRVDAPDLKAAARLLIDWLEGAVGFAEIAAVGHRVVHGGSRYHQAEPVTAELIAELRGISPYDPDHLPGEIELIEAFRNRDPDLPQVACFDTAFHHDMPRVAQIVPIPPAVRGRRRPALWLPWPVVCVSDGSTGPGGRPGASPGPCHPGAPRLGGEPVSGPWGPFHRHHNGLHPGLRAGHGDAHGRPRSGPGPVPVAGRGDDGRPVRQPREPRVRPARRLGDQLRRARSPGTARIRCPRGRGDRAVLLPGQEVDRRLRRRTRRDRHPGVRRGIGENAPEIRRRICEGLGFLVIVMDDVRNASSALLISTDPGPVKVRVIRTDEELMIARSAARLTALPS